MAIHNLYFKNLTALKIKWARVNNVSRSDLKDSATNAWLLLSFASLKHNCVQIFTYIIIIVSLKKEKANCLFRKYSKHWVAAFTDFEVMLRCLKNVTYKTLYIYLYVSTIKVYKIVVENGTMVVFYINLPNPEME